MIAMIEKKYVMKITLNFNKYLLHIIREIQLILGH